MSMIYVRTKPGRVARMSPSGPPIPVDDYVAVPHTRYIDRLLNVHQDIEKKPETKKVASAEKAAEAAKPKSE